jgi:predicted flap endonuclease-1-like 5' DNA nuclease
METYTYVIITGIICFIAGYFLGKLSFKKTTTKNNVISTKANKYIKQTSENTKPQYQKEIRAVQTRGRSGTSVELMANEGIFKGVKSTNKKKGIQLNFSGIGIASEADKDDLKKINGIGPFIEKKLNNIGIYTYRQISKFTDYEIDAVTQLIEFFPGRIKRDNWKQQAASLLKETKTK